MITSETLIGAFVEERPEREQELRLLLALQAGTVRACQARGDDLQSILLNPRLELSAVFRAAMANAYGHFDLLPVFFEDAKRMVIFKPLYKKLLAEWLPKDLLNA